MTKNFQAARPARLDGRRGDTTDAGRSPILGNGSYNRQMLRLAAVALVVGIATVAACGGGEDPVEDGTAGEDGGVASKGGDGDAGGSSGGGGADTSDGGPGDGAASGTDSGTAPVDIGPVGTCDTACTGSKMCNDTGDCVCAPGWTASGTDCVAVVVSNPATRTKAEVCDRYKAALKRPAALWKAGTGGECDPGTVPYEGQVAALDYLNFYRWMIGVGPVQVIPSVAKVEQECAKILGYSFSHSPPATTKCYTAAGAAACGASLIAGGFDLMTQFDGYAMETAQNLVHRRNVLSVGRAGVWAGTSNPGGSAMHYGSSYAALATDPEYVAHPGPGLNVRARVPSRWFVQKGTKTLPAVDARVFVVATGDEKPMTRYHHFNDFSSFDLSGWTPAVDTPYRVELIDDTSATVASFVTTFVDCP